MPIGHYNEALEEFTFSINEHYFLTDPDEMQFSHFPFLQVDSRSKSNVEEKTFFPPQGETDYDRWQLVAKPITLDEFNLKPHLSPAFFELGMQIVGDVPATPWFVQDQGVLRIKAWDVIRYKVSLKIYSCLTLSLCPQYKLWHVGDKESGELNNYSMCHLEGENRTLAVFTIVLPKTGDYYLKWDLLNSEVVFFYSDCIIQDIWPA